MFNRLFNVFSRREGLPVASKQKPLSSEFRNRVLMLLQDTFKNTFKDFLTALHRKVAYLHGKFLLSDSKGNFSPNDDLLHFLLNCKDEHFLDVLEIIFQSDLPGITWPDNPLISTINEFFRIDNLPYHLTGYSIENYETTFYDLPTTGVRITEYPKVIRKDSELLHKKAIEPALTLLNSLEFKQANNEFLSALEDFRKCDFRDCLTKCGSAFESVMKVLCYKNSISFKETDTASVLLKSLLAKGKLDLYWEQPLILIATLRNRLSSSHGAGKEAKEIPEHVATYVINATASAILLLSCEFSPRRHVLP